jgi:hypothetical protein
MCCASVLCKEQRLLWAPGVVEVMEDEGQMGRFAFCFPSVLVEVEEVEVEEVEVEEVVEVVPDHLVERNHCQLIPSSRNIHQTDYV